MCSMVVAVFLLCSSLSVDWKPAQAQRLRRSVSHAQLMHDKGRSLQEFKRRMWLQELLEEVHTAHNQRASHVPSQTFSGNAVYQKPIESTKDLEDRFTLDQENLPQETNKAGVYKDPPFKAATKRKKKVRLGRRRENDKKRRRVRSVGPEGA
ncbi:parathyroid hormone-related protein-like [Gouania willdenowi]|uniref:Parathyroid hormone-related protein-like n=1 Tax=Gouania willdenowi TaxID=441366 RepID=A0A8C5DW91_GOUWI|nr:parathyroid hormone-related protein-like [Gouania willdenowi]